MKKIMIIDDELDILNVLERFLSRTGKFEVETHSNPDVALGKIPNGGYDLILSDIMMPSTSGMDILKSAKDNSPHIKVILMTAYSNQHKIDQSNEYGVDAYLEKPFDNLRVVEETILSVF